MDLTVGFHNLSSKWDHADKWLSQLAEIVAFIAGIVDNFKAQSAAFYGCESPPGGPG